MFTGLNNLWKHTENTWVILAFTLTCISLQMARTQACSCFFVFFLINFHFIFSILDMEHVTKKTGSALGHHAELYVACGIFSRLYCQIWYNFVLTGQCRSTFCTLYKYREGSGTVTSCLQSWPVSNWESVENFETKYVATKTPHCCLRRENGTK